MDAHVLDRLWARSRSSTSQRVGRLRSKGFLISQCALAAGLAWWLAQQVLSHPVPFFAPIAAVLSLGTSYGQRLRRVVEVTIGVAVGVLVGDLLVAQVGTGWWQVSLVVALAMSSAFLLDGGQLLVTQAAVQSIVVTTLLPNPGDGLTRWTDALVGGVVGLVAATIVPAAPLRRPREQAAKVVGRIAELLRCASDVLVRGELEAALDLLADARATDHLIRELQDAADEGLSVVASSPFRIRHKGQLRQMAELVDPLDRALRSTRVLVRRAAVTVYHHRPVPLSYSTLCLALADAAEEVVVDLSRNQMAIAARPALLAVGRATAMVERTDELSTEVVLAQIRSTVVDLLLLTGLDNLEATDALPPTHR